MTTGEELRDFFISYTGADESWAEWIAWELEEAGYATVLQVWDFSAGAHFVTEMHKATKIAQRTIAVLSNAYLESSFAEAEWQEAWRADPTGERRKLLVFRIEDCPRPGLLGQLVSVDLFNVEAQMARTRLLEAVKLERHKPELPPNFPGQEPPRSEPAFPGMVPGSLDEAMVASGPMTPDNPWAIAFAFWDSVLRESNENLNLVITPESAGNWGELAALKDRTKESGLATGVYRPVYDVAYVKLINDVGADSPVQFITEGFPAMSMIISLVYRPELGGWRVHSIGQPLDPDDLPRSWPIHFSPPGS